MVRYLTNGVRQMTNQLGVLQAQGISSSNSLLSVSNSLLSVSNFSRLSATNTFAIATNTYGMSNSLFGVSNMLGSASSRTNFTEAQGNEQASRGALAAGSGQSRVQAVVESVTTASAPVDIGEPSMPWIFTWSFSGFSWTVNCNPFSLSWIVELAAFVKSVLTWSSWCALLGFMSLQVTNAFGFSGSWRQASSSGQALWGFNANLATSLVMAALITAAMYLLLDFCMVALGSYLGNLATVWVLPSSGALRWALWAANQFVPFSVLVAHMVVYVTFNLTLVKAMWLAQTTTRFLVG